MYLRSSLTTKSSEHKNSLSTRMLEEKNFNQDNLFISVVYILFELKSLEKSKYLSIKPSFD